MSATVSATAKPSAVRRTYRHGDLRRALIQAGLELARHGGPQAVVLRAATREVGVAPNAAYRHFADHAALVDAVRAAALAEAARDMEAAGTGLWLAQPGPEAARRALRAVGQGYLRFARREPGLFRTAFAGVFGPQPGRPRDPAAAGDSGYNPFELLARALDAMVAAGILEPARRPGAEYLAWSAVHGMAWLALEGPLRGAEPGAVEAQAERLLDMVEAGLPCVRAVGG
ncbi:TetR/AcrR family transcriptional regulator [Verticiella sediminum]|uniref:TetR/AcrR family transcriptional regulator n=1 Tax=Verticiella sediminum TaxID=1247510 RepID=A0A556AYP4_9BURK|nr:TetR-like C-terminal domain-containing protein [Verticiella sediminum]TSH98016.1 TetR/AcrR family transcriptional regulator [Verticiella sediminum]